jgi:hypothetical protein
MNRVMDMKNDLCWPATRRSLLMTRISRLTCLLTGLLAAGAFAQSPAKGPDAIEFKFSHQPGQVIRQRMTNKNVGTFQMPGPLPEQRMSQTFEQVIKTTCRQVNPDKSVALDVVMEDLAMKLAVAGMNFEYDTRRPEAAQIDNPAVTTMARMFSAMKGAVLTVTLSPSGHPTRVEGLSALMKKASEAVGDDPIASQTLQQMGSMFEDDTMAAQMQSWYALFPPEPGTYRVGDRWEHQWEMKVPAMNVTMQSKGEYKLLGVQEFRGRKCARIHARESLQLGTPDGVPASGGFLANMNMELATTSSNGIAYVDYENGQVVQYRQMQDWTMTMSMKGDPEAEDQASRAGIPPLTYKMKSTISIDLLEDGHGAEPTNHAQPGTQPAG